MNSIPKVALLTLLLAGTIVDVSAQETLSYVPALPTPPGAINDFESICGPVDDSQHVETYDGTLGPTIKSVESAQPAIAQIQWNENIISQIQGPDANAGNVDSKRWCSGTRISSDLFLTAAHCVDTYKQGNPSKWITPSRTQDGQRVYLLPNELAKLMHLNFNYQRAKNPPHNNRTPEIYPIVELVEFGFQKPPVNGEKLDYAILRIGPDASGNLPSEITYPPEPYDAGQTTLLNASEVMVIQHPDGEPKKIEAGLIKGVPDVIVLYSDLDTLGGASGSPVINKPGKVIAVHVAGGCELAQAANTGISLWAVKQVSAIIK